MVSAAEKYKKSCVACTQKGYYWCGDYNNAWRHTKCSSTMIPKNMCKHAASNDVKICYDEEDNPNYGGRDEIDHDELKKMIEGDPNMVDPHGCNNHVDTFFYTDLRTGQERFKVGQLYCFMSVNNLSGVPYEIQVIKVTHTDEQHLFYMSNTDETWNKRQLKDMRASNTDFEIGDPEVVPVAESSKNKETCVYTDKVDQSCKSLSMKF